MFFEDTVIYSDYYKTWWEINSSTLYSSLRLAAETALRPGGWTGGEEGALFRKHPLCPVRTQ